MTEVRDEAKVLAKFLGRDDAAEYDVTEAWTGSGVHVTVPGGEEYYVMTDEEATQSAEAEIEESLWAFKSSFVIRHSILSQIDDSDGEVEKMLSSYAEKKCEGARKVYRALIGDGWNDFVKSAIRSDGRGHFLSSYDGQESEQDDYFIYRVN